MPKVNFCRYFLLACVAALAWGCVSLDQYGSLSLDSSVREAFTTGEVSRNQVYYIMGSRVTPDAIIGINKAFTLNDDSWQPVDMTPDMLSQWVGRMDTSADPTKGVAAAAIYDNQGQAVGVWYSPWQEATILVTKENQVVVHPAKTKSAGGGGCG
ncbi:MAG: hypothetical protein JEZ02_06925 [Desulfatibacillum sp.]|nr:hypothetical protein [Desulfatibacillum sp.]